MRRIVPYIIALCIALWLGGLVTLFMSVSFMFKTDRPIAMLAAPMMFHIFERFQLVMAAVSLVSTIVWRLYACTKPKQALLACLMVAALLAIAQYKLIAPPLNRLRLEGNSGSDEFKRLHGHSMRLYVGTTVMTLIAGGAFIRAMTIEQNTIQKSAESAAA